MRYMVEKSEVQMVGHIWQPGIGLCATSRGLSPYDIENMRDDGGRFTRESCQRWVMLSLSGDFRDVIDFRVDISHKGEDFVSEWVNPESEYTYLDAVYGP